MANDTNVRGVYPYNAPSSPPKVAYYKANTAVAIFRGQLVTQNNSGQVQIVQIGTNLSTLGVAWEFLDANYAGLPAGMTLLPNSLAGTSYGPFLPSSTDGYVGVIYDPFQLYVVEEGTGGTALVAATAGMAISWTYQATTGNTTSGYANVVLDRSVAVTTGTDNMFQLIAPVNMINQDGTVNGPGNYCKWIVRINRHQFNPPAGGVGLGLAT